MNIETQIQNNLADILCQFHDNGNFMTAEFIDSKTKVVFSLMQQVGSNGTELHISVADDFCSFPLSQIEKNGFTDIKQYLAIKG
jgi:hypothetical protein